MYGLVLVSDVVRHPDREQVLRLIAVLLLILLILLTWLGIVAVGVIPTL